MKKAINTAYSTYYDKAIPLQYTVYNFFCLNRRKNGWTQFGKTSEARVTLGRHDFPFSKLRHQLHWRYEKWILLYMMVKIGMLFKTSDCWYSCRRGVGEPAGWWPPCPLLYSRLQSLLGSLPSPHSPPLQNQLCTSSFTQKPTILGFLFSPPQLKPGRRY